MPLVKKSHAIRTGENRLFNSIWLPIIWVIIALIPLSFVRDFFPANELRYVSIADEALSNGQIFAFTNHGIPYADKPPLYMWIVIACRWIAGDNCLWLTSLFSLIPGVVCALIMDRWTRGVLGEQYRAMATMLLLTCGLFTGMMVTLRMDMLMTMWIVLALYEFYKMDSGEGTRKSSWLFPIYVFLAVFTKGPLGIIIPLVGTATYLFTVGRLKSWIKYWNLKTWLVIVALCAVWFGGVYLDGGADYLDNLLFHQTVDRAVNSFHHKRPFYYYLVSMWYTFMPWAFLVLGSVLVALIRRSLIKSDIEKLFLSVGVSTIVILSFISGKLQVYLLPAYPFFVYFAAILISRYEGSRWLKAAVAVPAAVLSTTAVVILFLHYDSHHSRWIMPVIYVAGSIISLSAIISLVILFRKGGSLRKSVMTLGYGLIGAVLVASFAVGDFNPYIGYGRIAGRVKPIIANEPQREVYTWRVSRAENMDVYLGRPVEVLDPVKAGDNAERLSALRKGSLLIMPYKYLNDPTLIQGEYVKLDKAGDLVILEKQ